MNKVVIKSALGLIAIVALALPSAAQACDTTQVLGQLASLRADLVNEYSNFKASYKTTEGQQKINYYAEKITSLSSALSESESCTAEDIQPIEYDVKHIARYLNKVSNGDFSLHGVRQTRRARL